MRRFLLILFCSSALQSWADDPEWPRFRGADGDGSWNPAGLPASLAEVEPRRLWTQKIGGGYGGVTIQDGRAYVMDRIADPDEMERVLCFDAETGEPLWEQTWPVNYSQLDYGNGPRASVTIHEGKAFALGAKGMALCLDAVTGDTIWRRDMVRQFKAEVPRWGIAASPFIWKDMVLLHVGARPQGTTMALDIATGEERWRAGDDPAGYCTPVVFHHQGAPQLIQWSPEHILGFNPDTGEEHWRIPYKITYGVSIAQPIFHDGLLLVAGYWHGSRAVRLGETPGKAELAWAEEKELCGLMSQPLYREGVVYLLDKANGLTAFDLKTGAIHWRDDHHFTPKDRNPQMSLVWADEKQGVACGLNAMGELIFMRLAADGFEELSRHQVIEKTWAHPAFTRNTVIARSDTELAAWRLWE